MNLQKLIFSLSLFTLFTCYACSSGGTQSGETAKQQNEQLQGSWEVAQAERNGLPTETLDGLFFRFTEGKQLTTNLLGSDQENAYEISGNKILQKGDPALEYIIEALEDQQLILKTKLQGFDFKLILRKVTE